MFVDVNMVIEVFYRIQCRDMDAWMKVFREQEAARKAAGATGAQRSVYCSCLSLSLSLSLMLSYAFLCTSLFVLNTVEHGVQDDTRSIEESRVHRRYADSAVEHDQRCDG